MEQNALHLTEEDFGRSPTADALDLPSEIDKIWQRQQRERLNVVKPLKAKNFMAASEAEYGKLYSICIDEEDKEKIVKAEFLGCGRRAWRHLAFFRRATKHGKHVLHGIREYSLVKEARVELREQD